MREYTIKWKDNDGTPLESAEMSSAEVKRFLEALSEKGCEVVEVCEHRNWSLAKNFLV